MATARKVVVKKSEGAYSWSQTKESLTISLPVRNVLMKDINITIADLCLKVNVPAIKYVQIIDFPFPVDFASTQNRTQLLDDGLELFIMKKDLNTELWPELQLTGLNGKELTVRRNESLDRFYKWEEAQRQSTREKTYEMDKISVKQQMKIESHMRGYLDGKKQEIHDEEADKLEKELNVLEEKHETLKREKAHNMARAHVAKSDQQREKDYQRIKG